MARAASQFEAMKCSLLGLSVDSLYAHIAWVRAIQEMFDVTVSFPIVEDPSMAIGRTYGMLDEAAQDSAGLVRASYFIDPTGTIRALTWYPLNVGRSVDEMIRIVAALQPPPTVMTPKGWRPGGELLLPPTQGVAETLKAGAPKNWFYRAWSDG